MLTAETAVIVIFRRVSLQGSKVEPLYNEVLGTMKITLLYQVSHYIRVKKQGNIKSHGTSKITLL